MIPNDLPQDGVGEESLRQAPSTTIMHLVTTECVCVCVCACVCDDSSHKDVTSLSPPLTHLTSSLTRLLLSASESRTSAVCSLSRESPTHRDSR